jgi:hypothetical protein
MYGFEDEVNSSLNFSVISNQLVSGGLLVSGFDFMLDLGGSTVICG